MGRQISFFRSAEVESRLLAESLRIGLRAYPVEASEPFQRQLHNLTALGFEKPNTSSAWLDGEFIEYGYLPSAFSARLWFDPFFLDGSPKSGGICSAYDRLAKFIKRQAVFVRRHADASSPYIAVTTAWARSERSRAPSSPSPVVERGWPNRTRMTPGRARREPRGIAWCPP